MQAKEALEWAVLCLGVTQSLLGVLGGFLPPVIERCGLPGGKGWDVEGEKPGTI